MLPIAAPAFDAMAAYGIGLLAAGMAMIALGVVAHHLPAHARTAAVTVGAWMFITATLALAGVLARSDLRPPPMAVLIPLVLALAFAVGLSPFGGALARTVPLVTLVAVQMFRLPLELVMHRAAELGIMPPELTYTGYNLDIVTGSGAVVLFLAMRFGATVPRALVWLWNIWGVWCLAAIAVIAVTTSPMVRAFGDDPRHLNTWVLFFPYVWLPAVLVPLALAGHLVITRALLARPRSGIPA